MLSLRLPPDQPVPRASFSVVRSMGWQVDCPVGVAARRREPDPVSLK